MEPTAKVTVDILIAWSAIMTLLVTIIVGIMAFNLYRQWREAKDAVDAMSKQAQALEDKYHLSSLKTPDQILAEVRQEFDPQLRNLTSYIHRYSEDSGKGLETVRAQFDNRVKEIVAERAESERNVFRQVLNAFLEVKNLSDAERTAVSRALTPTIMTTSPSTDLVAAHIAKTGKPVAGL